MLGRFTNRTRRVYLFSATRENRHSIPAVCLAADSYGAACVRAARRVYGIARRARTGCVLGANAEARRVVDARDAAAVDEEPRIAVYIDYCYTIAAGGKLVIDDRSAPSRCVYAFVRPRVLGRLVGDDQSIARF